MSRPETDLEWALLSVVADTPLTTKRMILAGSDVDLKMMVARLREEMRERGLRELHHDILKRELLADLQSRYGGSS